MCEKKPESNIFNFSNLTDLEGTKKNTIINSNFEETNKDHNLQICEMKLSLRKKKLNEKLFSQRKIQIINNKNIDIKKLINLDQSFISLISQIQIEIKDEQKILLLLRKISFILSQKYKNKNNEIKHKIFNLTSNDLISNNWIYNLCSIATKYLNSSEVITLLTSILLLSFLIINDYREINENKAILNNKNETVNNNYYFISSNNYIDIYNKILSIYLKKNLEISYYMINFIGNISKNKPENQFILFSKNTMQYIIDSIDVKIDTKVSLEQKIWCLSKFENRNIYEENLEFSLKAQKIYIDIFVNNEKFELFKDINGENDENNFFYNYLKLIENVSYCTETKISENLIKSHILEFLINNFFNWLIFNNKYCEIIYIIIGILMNTTCVDSNLGKDLIDIGVIKYLTLIITDKSLPLELQESAFVPINNFFSDSQLLNRVLIEEKILKLFCSKLNDNNIIPGIFNEILFGFYQILFSYSNNNDINNLNILIDEYYLVQLVCKAMKQIIQLKKEVKINSLCYRHFCNLIMSLINIKNDVLIKKIIIKFQNLNGEEILEHILSNLNNMEQSKDILTIINMIDIIKEKIKDIELHL